MEIATLFLIGAVVNNKHTHTCGENVKEKIFTIYACNLYSTGLIY